MRIFFSCVLACGLVGLIPACGGETGGGTGGSSGTGGAGTGGSASGTGGSSGTGNTMGFCPHVDLGSAVPITHQGDTTGLPNLAESSRLEWGAAPDDTLLFTASAGGTYRISMPSEPSANGGCGASIQEFSQVGTAYYYDESWCPAQSMTANLDGVYAAGSGTQSDIVLSAGQKVLIWVSCTTWSSVQEGAYSIMIEKL